MRGLKRGAALMIVLFLVLLLLVLGMAFLGKQVFSYRSSTQAALSQQALGLAWAGLERCRAKLSKDIEFPPKSAQDQSWFSYTEEIFDLDGVTRLGNCSVTVDSRWAGPPYGVLLITAEGRVLRAGTVVSTRTLQAELDVLPGERGNPGNPNPTLWEYLNWTDRGSL